MTQPGVHAASPAAPDAPYLTWLGLHTAPFLPDPDDAFIYEDAGLGGQLGVLQHLVRFSDALIVVTGERGIGKTTLIRQFLSQHQGWQTCFVQAHALLSANEILQQLGCPTLRSGSRKPDALPQAPKAQPAADEPSAQPAAVVVVDDAHELPLATLQSLVELAAATDENGQRFRVVLAGEPPIEDLLAKLGRPLGQADTCALEVPALSEEESARYLQHRLAAAGLRGPSPFVAAHVRVLHGVSRGIPARLDAAAHQLLVALNARAKHPDLYERYFARLVALLHRAAQPRILIASAVAIILLAVLLPSRDRDSTPARPAQQTIALPLPQPSEPIAQTGAATPPAAGTDAAQPAGPAPVPVSTTLTVPTSPAAQPAATGTPSAEVRAGASRTPVPEKNTGADTRADSNASDSSAQGTAATITPPHHPTPPVRRESWLLAQNANHYTLQLLGTHNESAILGFISTHQLAGQVAYFRTYHKGKDWYVLLYGIYPSREAALAAVETLPKEARDLNPWARTIASVHADAAKATQASPRN